jgi:VIT1/CCC1 family predicted Fe2+/Mn2+ transporter
VRRAAGEDARVLNSTRVLDPFDRVSEVVFGVLMAMTFIGAMNVATAGSQEVRSVMIAALGCNVAWGLTDGVMYLVGIVTERTREKTRPRLNGRDFKGALGIFLLVTVSTFPLVVPFMVLRELGPALTTSRLLAVAMLFLCGWILARHAGGNGWIAGLAMAAIGAALTAALMALGG